MHSESSAPQIKAVEEQPKDSYLELVKQLMFKEILEDHARGPGPVADCLIFHYIMMSNWAFPVSANVLYEALNELQSDGLIKYDEENCDITLIAKIH